MDSTSAAEVKVYSFDFSSQKKKKKIDTHIITEALAVEKKGSDLVSGFSYFNCPSKLNLICQLKLYYDDWHRRG